MMMSKRKTLQLRLLVLLLRKKARPLVERAVALQKKIALSRWSVWDQFHRRDPEEFSAYGPNPLLPAPTGPRMTGSAVVSKHEPFTEAWHKDQVALQMEANQKGSNFTRGWDPLAGPRSSFLFPGGQPRGWVQGARSFQALWGDGGRRRDSGGAGGYHILNDNRPIRQAMD